MHTSREGCLWRSLKSQLIQTYDKEERSTFELSIFYITKSINQVIND